MYKCDLRIEVKFKPFFTEKRHKQNLIIDQWLSQKQNVHKFDKLVLNG